VTDLISPGGEIKATPKKNFKRKKGGSIALQPCGGSRVRRSIGDNPQRAGDVTRSKMNELRLIGAHRQYEKLQKYGACQVRGPNGTLRDWVDICEPTVKGTANRRREHPR